MPRVSSPDKRQAEAARLKSLRLWLGYSKSRLAEEWGVAVSAISQWENCERSIPGPVLKLMSIYETTHQKTPIEQVENSRVKRAGMVALSTAKITKHLAKSSWQGLMHAHRNADNLQFASEIALFKELANSMGASKGLIMKFGQVMSYTNIFMPSHLRALFKNLLYDSQPLDPQIVNLTICKELGKTPKELFKTFDPRPFSAASIGQVHRASSFQDEKLALKIQYPGIDQVIAADLQNSEFIEKFASLIFRGQERGSVSQELRQLLMTETDYRKELQNLSDFREIFANDQRIIIPKPFQQWSTAKILAMKYVDGLTFDEFLIQASPKERNLAGEIIFEVNLRALFEHRIFNCDPHPGNYLFMRNPQLGLKIAFLDFGSVRRFDEGFIENWRQQLICLNAAQEKEFHQSVVKMGFAPTPERFDFDYHYKMMQVLFKPITSKQPFHMTQEQVRATWQAVVSDNPNKYIGNLPSDWLALNRLQWGLYALLAQLDCEFDYYRLFEQYVSKGQTA